MSNALKLYLDDLSKFETFIDLNKQTQKKEYIKALEIKSMYSYSELKKTFIELVKELRIKNNTI